MPNWKDLTEEEIDALTEDETEEMLSEMTDEEIDELVDAVPDEVIEELASVLDEEEDMDEADEEADEEEPEDAEGYYDEGLTEELQEQQGRLLLLEEQLIVANQKLAEADNDRFLANVAAVMSRAEHYRDRFGRGHSKLVLDTTRQLLLMEPVKTGGGDNDVVLLEEEDGEISLEAMYDYFADAIIYLLENMPGAVPTTVNATVQEPNPGNSGDETTTDDEMKSFLEHTGVKSVVLEEGK